jgi:hypothetical protein
MNKNIIGFSMALCLFVGISKPAQATEGPADLAALVVTAVSVWAGAYSAWNIVHADDPTTILNQLARLGGKESWAEWYRNHTGLVTGASALTVICLNWMFLRVGPDRWDRRPGFVPKPR